MTDDGFAPAAPDIDLGAENPYEGADLSALPEWWRDAIEEFEEHDLRTYRPPRFEDGTLKYPVVDRLETEYGVTIDFVGMNVSPGDDWTVRIDGEPVGTIGRRRASEAYSVFEMSSDEFVEWMQAELDARDVDDSSR